MASVGPEATPIVQCLLRTQTRGTEHRQQIGGNNDSIMNNRQQIGLGVNASTIQ